MYGEKLLEDLEGSDLRPESPVCTPAIELHIENIPKIPLEPGGGITILLRN
jgi:hypothetical protein